ncbi:unnamed protein product [Didymodactylos carnosus]|uniref:Thioredoxin-like fold domain-containing protein n=1 Tax=Didymodactylos carnosus TaxID=1234261 RepID=A0A814G3M0_9BILA|nr:unnamed protein product [Didymodactylos carnosus]CAF1184342.1 unnamed protein product [Didymodactylos carnosus]CAF3762972.1 unnamed protein product [Didymodactylos carnosus]CAF3995460.1 unnamed protein product [Didymodactylos carnosus]
MPIPSRSQGFSVGPQDASITIDIFLDLTCGDCRSIFPTMLDLINEYNEKIQIKFHTFPLPYHTYSFIVNQAVHVISHLTHGNIKSILCYMKQIFDQQTQFYDYSTLNMSRLQIMKLVSSFIPSTIDKQKFLNGLGDATINREGTIAFKYGCSRGVVGTPTFMINGVIVQGETEKWTLNNFKLILDPLLNNNRYPSCKTPKNLVCCFANNIRQCPRLGCHCFYLNTKNLCEI